MSDDAETLGPETDQIHPDHRSPHTRQYPDHCQVGDENNYKVRLIFKFRQNGDMSHDTEIQLDSLKPNLSSTLPSR